MTMSAPPRASTAPDQTDAVAFCISRLAIVRTLFAWAEGQPARRADATALAHKLVEGVRSLGTNQARSIGPELDAIYAQLDVQATVDDTGTALARLDAIIKGIARSQPGRRTSVAEKAVVVLGVWRTAIEVVLIVALLLTVAGFAVPAWLYPDRSARLADLKTLRGALVRYKMDNGHYPISHNPVGGNNWTGIGWDGVGLNWLPDLVPKYLAALPRDPRNTEVGQANYLYSSNGTDFKLISLATPECRFVIWRNPRMNDPARNTRKSCMAYGYWTAGAATW